MDTQIFTLLKSLGISQKFVYPTIQRYNEMGDVVDHPRTAHPCTARTQKAVEDVRSRIRRNSLCKQKVLAQPMKISPRSVSRVLGDDFMVLNI